jgi:hypothetical protein
MPDWKYVPRLSNVSCVSAQNMRAGIRGKSLEEIADKFGVDPKK